MNTNELTANVNRMRSAIQLHTDNLLAVKRELNELEECLSIAKESYCILSRLQTRIKGLKAVRWKGNHAIRYMNSVCEGGSLACSLQQLSSQLETLMRQIKEKLRSSQALQRSLQSKISNENGQLRKLQKELAISPGEG